MSRRSSWCRRTYLADLADTCPAKCAPPLAHPLLSCPQLSSKRWQVCPLSFPHVTSTTQACPLEDESPKCVSPQHCHACSARKTFYCKSKRSQHAGSCTSSEVLISQCSAPASGIAGRFRLNELSRLHGLSRDQEAAGQGHRQGRQGPHPLLRGGRGPFVQQRICSHM